MTAQIDQKLASALLELELLKKSDLDLASTKAKAEKKDLGTFLVQNDFITDENLAKLVADTIKYPTIRLSNVNIPLDVLNLVPEEFAEKYRIIPFKKEATKLCVATSDPFNTVILNNLKKKLGGDIEVYFATELDIESNLHLFKRNLETVYTEITNKSADKKKLGKILDESLPIEKILGILIEYAHDRKASDIHLNPDENKATIRFRIDGILSDMLVVPRSTYEQLINKIKVDAKLRTDEHLSAQDGKIREKIDNDEIDIRISLVPAIHGENAVLRLLSSNYRQYGLIDLGMSEQDLDKVKRGFNKPYGMVLSTGPTGSGKTTSMYSILKILNTREVNIATIEDPVEYSIQGITQIQVNSKANITFANGLRSILRQDPNIIYVGEIRDKETADISVNAALTGHLVLSTLHTNDASTAIPRLTDMDVEPFLLASTVNTIIAQRLVRKICEACKVSYTTTADKIAKDYNITLDKKTVTLYQGKGCPVCKGTGYANRIGIFEILEVTKEIRDLITTKATADTIRAKAIEQGMTTMIKDGIDKALLGITTLDEVLRVTRV